MGADVEVDSVVGVVEEIFDEFAEGVGGVFYFFGVPEAMGRGL